MEKLDLSTIISLGYSDTYTFLNYFIFLIALIILGYCQIRKDIGIIPGLGFIMSYVFINIAFNIYGNLSMYPFILIFAKLLIVTFGFIIIYNANFFNNKLLNLRIKLDVLLLGIILGIVYAQNTPGIGPILGSIFAMIAAGHVTNGSYYFFFYTIGIIAPVAFIIILINLFNKYKFSNHLLKKAIMNKLTEKYCQNFKLVWGVIIILCGILLLIFEPKPYFDSAGNRLVHYTFIFDV